MADPLANPQFIVLSLPRSRSAWMAHFLRYGGTRVGHDLIPQCSSIAEFRARLAPLAGTCETGAVLGWKLIKSELPSAKLVVVKRDPLEVAGSLAKFGIEPDLDELVRRWVMLDIVSDLPGTLTIPYHALRTPEACKALFEFCLDFPFDWDWWSNLHTLRIEIDMAKRLELLAQNSPALEAFKAEVAARSAGLSKGLSCLN